MSDNSQTSGGFSLFTLIGVVFVTLKLTGAVTWPWLWVLSPFWIPAIILLSLLAIIGVVICLGAAQR